MTPKERISKKATPDTVALNLQKLEQLVPGSVITLSTGEPYVLLKGGVGLRIRRESGFAELLWDTYRPLFEDAIRGGASVELPHQEIRRAMDVGMESLEAGEAREAYYLREEAMKYPTVELPGEVE
jgi:hypothetical protein